MQTMTLQNGETVSLTLNFASLYTLRAQRPEVYKEYSKAVNEVGGLSSRRGEADTVWSFVQIIYTAYLCGAVKEDRLADALSFTAFLAQMPEDTVEILLLGNELLSPNRRGGSASRSNKRRAAESAEKA